MKRVILLISIICPVYNEEKTINIFWEHINSIIKQTSETFEFIFVDDGSHDNSIKILEALSTADNRCKIVKFSRNFGKDIAITAGMDYAKGDAVIPIDIDLQDPPSLIIEMIEKWREGYDVVLAKRGNRKSEGTMKRITSSLFYSLYNKISHPKIPHNVGDFRLMSRKVVEAVKKLPERQRFMKGIFSWVGFSTYTIEYIRPIRSAGTTKYNYKKMWQHAMDGITSSSTLPLTFWLYSGTLIALLSSLYGIYIFLRTLILGVDVPGYASIICLILFFGGLQLMGIGIIGEYIGRTYIETKQRPLYITEKTVNF